MNQLETLFVENRTHLNEKIKEAINNYLFEIKVEYQTTFSKEVIRELFFELDNHFKERGFNIKFDVKNKFVHISWRNPNFDAEAKYRKHLLYGNTNELDDSNFTCADAYMLLTGLTKKLNDNAYYKAVAKSQIKKLLVNNLSVIELGIPFVKNVGTTTSFFAETIEFVESEGYYVGFDDDSNKFLIQVDPTSIPTPDQ